jgi:hypothetical protein
VPPAVALLNYISCGMLWRIFSQTAIFAGFSLNIIFILGSISAAVITGDLIFFSLGGPVGDYTGANTVIFRGIFSIYYSADGTSEAAMGGAGAWLGARKGDIIF